MKTSYILWLVFLNSFFCFTQDSITKNQTVQEIIIQGKKNTDDKNLSSDVDLTLEEKGEITLIRRGNFALEPTIRGLNGSQINLQIDGMQIFGACTDRMDPISSYIEPSNLKSIEINTQSDNGHTGNGLIGGINFKTQQARLDTNNALHIKLGSNFNSNGFGVKSFGLIEYGRKKWAIGINGIYRQSMNYSAASKREVLFSQFQKFNFGINSTFLIAKNQLLTVNYIQDDAFNVGYPALTMDVGFAKAKIGSVSWRVNRKNKSLYSIDSKIYMNYIDHAMDDTRRPPEQIFMHMDMPGTSRTFGFYSILKSRFKEKHFLNLNLFGFQNDLHAEMTMYPDLGAPMFMLTIPDGRRKQFGFNISYKYYGDTFYRLETGGKLNASISQVTTIDGRKTLSSIYPDSLNQFDLNFTLFANHSFKIGEKLNLSISNSYGSRSASIKEMYGFYLYNRNDNYDYIGQPNIETEKLLSSEIGISYKTKKVHFSSKLFHYQFFDYIAGVKLNNYGVMTFGASGVKQFGNIGLASITGAEIDIHWKIIRNLNFHTTNSFSYGIDDEKRNLPMIPPLVSRSHLTYNLYSINIQLEYIKSFSQNSVDFDFYGETKSNGYDLFNISVNKTFNLSRSQISVSGSVQNIFDVDYYNHLDVLKLSRPGRSYEIGLIWTY